MIMVKYNPGLLLVKHYIVTGKEMAEKILSAKEDTNFGSQDLKVGGKGMKGFYGEPSEGKEGIVGSVAKALVKEFTGKPAEIVETKIELIDSKVDFDTPPSISKSPDGKIGVMSPFEGEGKVFDADQKQEALSYFRQQKEKFEQEISKLHHPTLHRNNP